MCCLIDCSQPPPAVIVSFLDLVLPIQILPRGATQKLLFRPRSKQTERAFPSRVARKRAVEHGYRIEACAVQRQAPRYTIRMSSTRYCEHPV